MLCRRESIGLHESPPGPINHNHTANVNAGAETTTVNAFPEHISTISVHRLMYPGWNGKLLCEYQPWFSEDPNPPAPYSPYNGHIEVGYDETKTSVNAATVKNPNSNMIARGCNINFIDFYGSTDQNMGLNKNGSNAVYKDLANRTNYPLKLGILEDIGAFKTACLGQSEAATITCVEGALQTDMTYIYQTYILNTPRSLLE